MASETNLDVDMSELIGKRFCCEDKCGLCCLCQPELLPHEEEFFRRNYPTKIVSRTEPHKHMAIALKKGDGPCEFLENKRCLIYANRPHFCRQFPFHIYLGTRVQVELDLSCQGVWMDRGEDAMVAGGQMVEENLDAIRTTLPKAKAVYQEFHRNCQDAGIYRSPESLRKDMSQNIPNLLDLHYLAKVLDLSAEEEEMTLPGSVAGNEYRLEDIELSARETGMDSLSAEDVFSAPVYCDKFGKWNLFLARDGKIEWKLISPDGGLIPVRTVDPTQVRLLTPEGEGKGIFLDYFRTLNARDSAMGYACFLVDNYGYEDYVANTYYGTLATCALDLLWRASLIAYIRNGKLDKKGMIEGIIAYDMDRLDAPTIGAFV